jgi:hypothetical protein
LRITFVKLRITRVIVIALSRTVAPVSVGISARLIDKGADNPEIVLGMLKVTFRQHTIAGRRRIARKVEILLMHLIRIAADPNLGAVAVESLVTVRSPGTAVMVVATATTTAATPPTFDVWTLSHI